MARIIHLADLTRGEVHNLSGHDRGLKAREMFSVAEMDSLPEEVVVVVPDDLDAISNSFFQGMFSDSVKQFGSRESFFDHYRFEASAPIIAQVQRGIDSVLTRRDLAFA